MKNKNEENAPRPDPELNLGQRLESARDIITDLWNQLGVLKKHGPEDPCPKPFSQTIERMVDDAYDIIDVLWQKLRIANLGSENSAAAASVSSRSDAEFGEKMRLRELQIANLGGKNSAAAASVSSNNRTLADYEEKMKQAKTPQARAAVAADFEKSINENRIAHSADDPTTGTLANFEEKMKQAKTPQARAAIAADFEKAIKENRIVFSGNSTAGPATPAASTDFEERMNRVKTPEARAAVAAEFERSVTGK
jgi:hypothetical protein